jgi:EpsD family peptidyl-prolyl cis-trans isomerase
LGRQGGLRPAFLFQAFVCRALRPSAGLYGPGSRADLAVPVRVFVRNLGRNISCLGPIQPNPEFIVRPRFPRPAFSGRLSVNFDASLHDHPPAQGRPASPVSETKPHQPRTMAALVVALTCALPLLSACGGQRGSGATQTAAKVNKAEITVHQINYILQQQRGLRPEQAEGASRQILQRLIDQELAVQRADDLKLDRDPRVAQQLQATRRDVLAQAYADKVGEAATKPTADEVSAYFRSNPALFSQRRIYTLQEITIEAAPEQVTALRTQLDQSANVAAFIDHLKAQKLPFTGTEVVRPAEQIALANLQALAGMKPGQALLSPTATGAQVQVVVATRDEPVAEDLARPLIEQFLLNDRKRQLLEEERKVLRSAATIQLMGRFADGAASAPTVAQVSPRAAPVGEDRQASAGDTAAAPATHTATSTATATDTATATATSTSTAATTVATGPQAKP